MSENKLMSPSPLLENKVANAGLTQLALTAPPIYLMQYLGDACELQPGRLLSDILMIG